MAEINLSKEETIKVNLSSESPINANVPEINYIPGYKIAEEQRRANELERIENETEREEYYEEIQTKVANGEFNGEAGPQGPAGKDGTVAFEELTEEQVDSLRGPKGDDGYTPVKGVDYFTEAEQEELENDVITRIQSTLNNNLKQAKDYTDNAIIKDFKDVSYNQNTATFVFTRHDNTTFTVDLPIEQTVKNGYYDETNKDLVLVLVSDQEIRIPASGLIDDYTGVDSATIQCVISADNKVTCNIIGGSITKTLLTTELQEEINNKVKQVEYSQTATLPSGSDAGYYGRAYVRDKTNVENSIPICSQNRNYTMPIRDHNGNFYVANPTIAYHCANKQYVDDLVGDIESLLSEV